MYMQAAQLSRQHPDTPIFLVVWWRTSAACRAATGGEARRLVRSEPGAPRPDADRSLSGIRLSAAFTGDLDGKQINTQETSQKVCKRVGMLLGNLERCQHVTVPANAREIPHAKTGGPSLHEVCVVGYIRWQTNDCLVRQAVIDHQLCCGLVLTRKYRCSVTHLHQFWTAG